MTAHMDACIVLIYRTSNVVLVVFFRIFYFFLLFVFLAFTLFFLLYLFLFAVLW